MADEIEAEKKNVEQSAPPEPRGKISLVEGIIMVMITATADLIEILLTFVGANPLSIIIDVPVTATIQFWLWMKGSRWAWALAGNLIEFIPYIDFLPIRTFTLLTTIFLSGKPRVSRTADTNIQRLQKIAGRLAARRAARTSPREEAISEI